MNKMISKQLHGSRPTSLMVSKNSSKIKKPVMNQHRSPVVVYLQSPKIIHVSPREFMSLVQRLTGNQGISTHVEPSLSSSSSSSLSGNEVASENGKVELESTSANHSSFSAACRPSLDIDIYADHRQKFGKAL
uniref:VQ domain-containing protein n=1 Tax=Davidia involucrata TaxID=16924 RepID=A0A5B7C935_DAVIN